MALAHGQAIRLARRLRRLRESEFSEVVLTQAQLADAFSTETKVAPATLSSWESQSNPKTPTASRLSAYARFFATRRSLENKPHLIAEDKLTAEELDRFHELDDELRGLLQAEAPERRSTFSFEEGPITIICPALPPEERGPLADPAHPNYNRLQLVADADALLEMWGHVRAENPNHQVRIRLPEEVVADDLSVHVIVLGGIAWNRVTLRFQKAIGQVPITQVGDPQLKTGDIFRVKDERGEKEFNPEWENLSDTERELIEDVALIVRLRNPFQSSRTLTICNGIHSRGVLGAVRTLTDQGSREANERYLTQNFPDEEFALLLRVPVVSNETITPDLQDPAKRLYEWAPDEETHP